MHEALLRGNVRKAAVMTIGDKITLEEVRKRAVAHARDTDTRLREEREAELAETMCCDTCEELRVELTGLRAAALAYQDLAVCYRLGKRPTEKLFKRLDKAKAALRQEGGG
jgi:hypothetical protein